MRRPLVLSTLALSIALAAPAQAQDPRIAAGVSAAGVDISGLTLAEAASKLNTAHAAILARPLIVSSAGHQFTLTPGKVGYKFDALRTARRAFQQGYRPHSGPLDVNLYATYDKRKITAFARRVIAGVTIAARDASVHIKLTRIAKVPSRTGRTLKLDPLKAAIRAALIDSRVSRTVKPKLVRTRPKVTTAGLGRAYGTVITIDRSSFTLRLFKRLRVAKTYRVAVGQPAYPTPTGLFSVANKAVNPAWTAPNSPWAGAYANETVPGGSAENPLKARWMGLRDGIGIHGTGEDWSIGSRASHGCIRMHVADVIDLYPRVPLGTPVLIGG
jgi:lipoprotein-anchoring transpeptidase ErfK/SrfK